MVAKQILAIFTSLYSLKTPKREYVSVSRVGELRGQQLTSGALTGTSQAGRNARE